MNNKQYYKRKKPKRRLKMSAVFVCLFFVALFVIGVYFAIDDNSGGVVLDNGSNHKPTVTRQAVVKNLAVPDWVDVDLIAINGGGRTGEKLEDTLNIVVHYIGNPGTTAAQNRNFFNQKSTKVSAHFVVGLKGEIIQCVPLDERSAASNHRNKDTISIEVCHSRADGKFNQDTYNAVIKLTAWLCEQYDLTEKDVIRHYDVTGKECPKYFVDNPDEWIEFKNDVKEKLN